MVLDAGALIGIDRSDRRVAGLIALGRRTGADLVTMAPVVAQAWRDGARQVHLARALAMIDVVPMGLDVARSAGELLKVAGGSDVVDASVALLARPGDQILTSDPGDLDMLVKARPVAVAVVRV
ncbi:hypothetical protein [Pseudonocardia sp. TRM90224]|uniref:hypothetical protein n=1 Tax=Pseudonocardia sp. TRM90224 TaxID=2812678 RepID=UPI001E384C68|nr:hypothetical protein [Pseudonocardia sp. TRM90224]